MNRAILHERLIKLITQFAQGSSQSRQVARRLDSLLPQRLRELKAEHSRKVRSERVSPLENQSRSERIQAKSERLALTDERYLSHLNDLITIQGEAVTNRIQYETYLMLFEARRTMRQLVR